MTYTLTIYKSAGFTHTELGSYTSLTPPLVPAIGSYYRFRDPCPPGKPADHRETAGRVHEVVTIQYGTSTVVEIYIRVE